jgi:hypothetical protein
MELIQHQGKTRTELNELDPNAREYRSNEITFPFEKMVASR